MHAIETMDLTKKFGNLTAVDNVNVQVEEGEIFGLLGPNGAGKSTTISMLCTILKPTFGTAKVNGYDIFHQPGDVRKSIALSSRIPVSMINLQVEKTWKCTQTSTTCQGTSCTPE